MNISWERYCWLCGYIAERTARRLPNIVEQDARATSAQATERE